MIRAQRTHASYALFVARKSAILASYFEVHADNEVDQGGTARAALYINDKASAEENFIKLLEMLERAKLPRYSEAQFKDADLRLNTLYQKIQKTPEPEWGTVTKDNIKKTQRGWIRYADAWVKFCGKKYPDVSQNSIRAYLTLERIKELEDFD